MTKRIPAIPTSYNNIDFRSKLEVKYARLLDDLNIPYEYEGVAFEFEDGTKYLPDFWLPRSEAFLEIKGIMEPLDGHKIYLMSQEQDVIVGDCEGWMTIYNKEHPNGQIAGIAVTDEGFTISKLKPSDDKEVELLEEMNSSIIGRKYRLNNFFDDAEMWTKVSTAPLSL